MQIYCPRCTEVWDPDALRYRLGPTLRGNPMTENAELEAPEKRVPVLYLDLDGTVRQGKDDALGRFVNGPEDVVVFPEAVEMMRRWKAGGGRIAGVSNQGGIALGIVSLEKVAAAVMETQRQCQGLFDRILFCSASPNGVESARGIQGLFSLSWATGASGAGVVPSMQYRVCAAATSTAAEAELTSSLAGVSVVCAGRCSATGVSGWDRGRGGHDRSAGTDGGGHHDVRTDDRLARTVRGTEAGAVPTAPGEWSDAEATVEVASHRERERASLPDDDRAVHGDQARAGDDSDLGTGATARVLDAPEGVAQHHPKAKSPEMARCWCRKPSAGAVVEAAHGLVERFPGEIYPPYMGLFVGDRPEDQQCAESAGLDFMWAAEWRAQAALIDGGGSSE